MIGYSLAESRFSPNRFLRVLSPLPFALPSIVVALSFVMVYGNATPLGKWYSSLTGGQTLLYNRWAIVFAHVFFNVPFFSTYLARQLEAIPIEYRKTASNLGFSRIQFFRSVAWYHIRLPLLSSVMATAAFSLSSFGIVLLLGAKPEFTTAEIAVYQALRFDFNLIYAAIFSGIQLILICLLLLTYRTLASYLERAPIVSEEFIRERLGQLAPVKASLVEKIVLTCYSFFLVLPLLAIVKDGIKGVKSGQWSDSKLLAQVAQGAFQSLLIASCVGIVTPFVAWFYIRSVRRLFKNIPALSNLMREVQFVFFGISPSVLGFAWFVVFRNYLDPFESGLILVLAIHAMLALPICIRILEPRVMRVLSDTSHVVKILGLSSWHSLSRIEFLALRRTLLLSGMAAFGISWGEVAVTSMFTGQDFRPLPVLMTELMGNYRFNEAAALALALAVICVVAMYALVRKFE